MSADTSYISSLTVDDRFKSNLIVVLGLSGSQLNIPQRDVAHHAG
ncbi:MAG TPA: hypothetical protein VIS48_00720 [Candidatus Kryptonia bacterium]